LYLSVSSTSPSTLFGGTWEQIESDAYLKIVTSNGGSLGGTSSNHTIPLTSMPAHTHSYTNYNSLQATYRGVPDGSNAQFGASSSTSGSSGGGQAYYPYYLGVYVWKRTA